MNLFHRFFLFFFIVSFAFAGFAQNIKYDTAYHYSISELQADFQFLRTKLQKTHPNLYLYTPRAELDLFFDSLYTCIAAPLSETEFFNIISPLNSKIKDGHTMVLPGERATNYYNQYGKFLPFYFVISNDKLYVNMNCSSDTSIKEGAEILGINEMSTKSILNELLPRQIRDGYNQTYPIWILTTYFKEYYGFSLGHPSVFSITYKKQSAEYETKVIDALSKDSIRLYKQSKYSKRTSIINEKKGIWLEVNKQTHIATLTIKSFDNDRLKSLYNQDFKSAIDSSFIAIRDGQINDLILDIRNNQGGDFEPGRALLSYLLDQPITYLLNSKESRTVTPKNNVYKGNLYILINGGSFSNTGIVSSYLELRNRGVFIGEETAGNKNIISGDPIDIVLPNTKIIAEISTTKYVIRNAGNNGHGVLPAYQITPAIENIITDKDEAMELALMLIPKNK